MAQPRCVAIVPMDRAAVVYERFTPARMITKHKDGEIVKLTPHEDEAGNDVYAVDRRHELDVSWTQDGGHHKFTTAYGSVADRQAFGVRFNDAPRTLVDLDSADARTTETVEIEPLNLGAILVDSTADLPLTLHTVDGDYWRLREAETQADSYLQTFVVEHQPAESTAWEEVETLDVEGSVANIVPTFANHARVLTTDEVSAAGIKDVLDQPIAMYKQADFPTTDDEVAERMGMQTDTLNFD